MPTPRTVTTVHRIDSFDMLDPIIYHSSIAVHGTISNFAICIWIHSCVSMLPYWLINTKQQHAWKAKATWTQTQTMQKGDYTCLIECHRVDQQWQVQGYNRCAGTKHKEGQLYSSTTQESVSQFIHRHKRVKHPCTIGVINHQIRIATDLLMDLRDQQSHQRVELVVLFDSKNWNPRPTIPRMPMLSFS